MNFIAGLMLVATGRHYLWPLFPLELQGMASKGLGACAILALLACIWHLKPSKPLAWVLAWWAWEELQVALCALAYMAEPWAVQPGQGICSDLVGLDIGAAGILALAVVAHNMSLSDLTGSSNQGNGQNERQ